MSGYDEEPTLREPGSGELDAEGDPEAEDSPEARRRARVAGGFIREIVIFHVGVLIGVLWHWFAAEAPATGEAHIIVVLSIIILCMARFIQLMKM